MSGPSHLAELVTAIAHAGFIVRGGFHTQADDEVPVGVASVVLIGNAGAEGFAAFEASPEFGNGSNPLDRYSERVIGALARGFDAQPVFPHQGPPWWPFQRWAMRAEPVFVSPLQILIHPQHGLWHAYRAALLFRAPLAGLPVADEAASPGVADAAPGPCAQCASQPCLSACPVDAFDGQGFDRDRCAQHLRSPAGRRCLDEGCAARNACPVAGDARYGAGQIRFHMRAFLRSLPSTATNKRSSNP